MSIERVRRQFKELGIEDRIVELDQSSATVELAAHALGCQPRDIAKTLAFDVDGDTIVIVAVGDARIDNAKYKNTFGKKAKMLHGDQVEERTGHAIGGVCPFGLKEGVKVYLDRSLKQLEYVYPACVVIAIGLSLLSVGMDSWGGGSGVEDFGAWYHLFVGAFTLIVCLVSRYLLKGVYKNLNILVGLVFGYILATVFTAAGIAPMVDLSGISETVSQVGYFSLPKLVFLTEHKPIFDVGAFFTIAIVFLVSAAETTGATTAVCTGALNRDIKTEELQGSLAVDGFSSAISGCFGCLPLTSFSQNVGLVTMTGVINRFTIFMGAIILILASLFPPLGALFNSIPQSVLGGCTVMMFGSIMYEGIKMLKECVFDDRTMIIVSLSFCIGVGLTQTSGNFFSCFPQAVGDIFNGNAVAGVFVVSLLLSLFLPKDKKTKE